MSDADEIWLRRVGRVAVRWGVWSWVRCVGEEERGRIEHTLIVPAEALRISDSNTDGRGSHLPWWAICASKTERIRQSTTTVSVVSRGDLVRRPLKSY